MKDTGTRVRDLLRVGEGFRLEDVDPRATPGFEGGKSAGKRALAQGAKPLTDLQERLFAEARGGGERSLLLLIQGMDTSGKGGIMRHVMGAVDPQGVDLTAFKKPTEEELSHGFLWRVRKALPRPGQIGVFDRSHYEDVLVARVHHVVPEEVWRARYDEINEFEAGVVAAGTPIVKVMLHISADEQKKRLLRRLDRPDKYWKFDPADIDEREHWGEYQAAYQGALTHCSTQVAPWYAVPADRKWYARLAVHHLLVEALRDMDPKWPAADFDVDGERARLLAT
ncbi:MAG TPA: polyphosphate kinase 2 family protein [Actinomycetales bacterium]|nr:polyphosphate kinase 2 family protein [Actinomycetales bacterium]